MLLEGGISQNGYEQTIQKAQNPLLDSLNSAWKTVLFMEALRNLNWSRGYCWYVELDGVPNPFQRGGVLGLPCTSVSFTLAQGSSFGFNAGISQLRVPQNISTIQQIQLTVLDDEQGTIRQFFERWYNQVYNPYYGVLPVTEACKQISIYLQKSTRRNVKRVYFDIDTALNKTLFANAIDGKLSKSTDSMDFLVYPTETFQIQLDSTRNDLISYTISLDVAYFVNQDFGNPNVNNGVKTLLDTAIGGVSNGSSWLDKIGDYI
jgi:hypothetical protein